MSHFNLFWTKYIYLNDRLTECLHYHSQIGVTDPQAASRPEQSAQTRRGLLGARQSCPTVVAHMLRHGALPPEIFARLHGKANLVRPLLAALDRPYGVSRMRHTAVPPALARAVACSVAPESIKSPRSWSSKLVALLKRLWRAFVVALRMLPLGAALLLFPVMTESGKNRLYRLFRLTLEQCGCAFVKLGQWMSHREDMFPPLLCSELQRLRADGPFHSLAHTDHVITQAFGKPRTELFSCFNTTPIASGSIAQVYKARLKNDPAAHGKWAGRWVAVKGAYAWDCRGRTLLD